jgi:hypothetical protein
MDRKVHDIKAHIIPATEVNRYWDDWYKISQVRNGRVERINNTAIRLEKVAARLGTAINNQVKIQRFLDAMHPELRYAVEPEVKDRATASWKDVKELANRKDDGLFQAGRYGRNQPADQSTGSRQPHSSNATAPRSSQAMNPQGGPMSNATNFTKARQRTPGGGGGQQGPRSPRKLSDNEKANTRKEKRCFYCKKQGHFMNDCRAKEAAERNGRYIRTAHTTATMSVRNVD